MKILTVIFLAINFICISGEYYDITSVYRFNTEEVYDNGEVITKYLNTCAVSVHPQTNAVNLPFINLNTATEDDIHYPLQTTIPPLEYPYTSSHWKTLTTAGTIADLDNDSLVHVDHETLSNYMNEKAFITLLKKGKMIEQVNIGEGVKVLNENLMTSINKERNVFLSVQIKKGEIKCGTVGLYMHKGSNYIKLDIEIYDSNKHNRISVFHNDYRHYTYNLMKDEQDEVSIYINLDGYPKIYDAIGNKIHGTNDVDILDTYTTTQTSYITSIFEHNPECRLSIERWELTGNIVKLSSSQVLPLKTPIITSGIDIKNKLKVVVSYFQKSDTELEISIKELSTGHFLKLETEDLVKFHLNKTDMGHIVVTKVNVRFPDGWTNEKQIYIKDDENINIIKIWEGRVLDYLMTENKNCKKSSIKDIYGAVA